MKKKRLIATLLSLAVGMTFGFSSNVLAYQDVVVDASETAVNFSGELEPMSLQSICANNDCQGLTTLQCRKSKFYSYDYTHRYNFFTAECTVNVYESPYIGHVCSECGSVWAIGIDLTARHPCSEYHNDCGDGWADTGDCRDGQSY